jgi:hypothetical protein
MQLDVTTPATAFTTFTNATCNGDSNGTITVTPTGGVAPFTFDLSGTGSIQQEMLTDFTPDYQQVLTRL